jgi:signal peptidase I
MQLHQRISRFVKPQRSLLVFIVGMLLFRSAFADWMNVPSGSMNPTLIEGDRILVDKRAYGLRVPFTTTRLTRGADPARGDIVIFPSPEDGTVLVKRVVGLPNDQWVGYQPNLDLAKADSELPRETRAQDRLYLTERLADRPHAIMVLPGRGAMRSFGPTLVPAGEYLVLGDSRDNSKDSRYIGFVPRASIVGRAFGVAWSLDAERWYKPRGDRLLKPLR